MKQTQYNQPPMSARLKRSTAAIILALALPFIAMPSHAKLSDELDDMFANVTAPGSFSTTLRDGWAGGGVGIRAPIRNISVISFDPPRLSAGCGGIDLFGGSFSFINSEQLIALLRAIAANAIGVAFKAAIDAINPQLGKIMGDFQQIVQNLNQGLSNTCALASTIVRSTASYLGVNEMAKSSIGGEQTAVGDAIDSIASFTGSVASTTANWFNKPATMTEKAAGKEKMRDVGNLVWKALGASGVANEIGNPITGDMSKVAGKEFIMSLLGTVVIGAGEQGETTGEGGYDGNEAPPPKNFSSWTVSMRLLRDGPQDEQNKKTYLLKCSQTGNASGGDVPDGACNIVTKVQGPTDFVGIKGYVNTMFFGNSQGKAFGVTADSIIGKMQTCSEVSASNACNFTTQQEKLLQSISGPVLAQLRLVQHNRTAMAQVAAAIVPMLANQLSMSYANMVLMTASQAFDGKNQEPAPDFVKEQVSSVQTFLQQAEELDRQMWDEYEKVQTYVQNIIKNEPNLLASPTR